ncbi:MAG TPA: peptidylprolyl isomerase [Candidatus Binatia bacterium]|nr:peptidylprolyl isomerase [Candidatus Binatia bacterium]
MPPGLAFKIEYGTYFKSLSLRRAARYMLRQVINKSLLLFFLLVFPHGAAAAVIEQLIAIVNGEPYTLSNLNSYAKSKMGRGFPSGDLNQINANDREVLEQFITDKLLEAEVRDAGIVITDDDVTRYVEQVKKNNRLSDEDLKVALGREGVTLAAYRASVKLEMEKSEIIDRQVRRKVNITDEDVERYYKLNSKNYRGNDRARIRHILLALAEDAPPERVQSVMATGKELYQRIVAGEDFAALAREYSEGAGRADGGEIGWVNRGTLIGGIEEVAFEKLSVGQVSEPFRTSMGVHIVKLEGREAGGAPPLSSIAPRIKEELLKKTLEERFARWLKSDLRRKHRVDIKVAGVVFKPEDSKEATVNSLVANSNRTTRRDDRSVMSYLNPFSYIVKETPFEDEDAKSPLKDKSVVSVFGVPLFTTDTVEDAPDVLSPPPSESGKGVFSTILDSLNPFSSKKP